MGMTELAPCPGGRIYTGSTVARSVANDAVRIMRPADVQSLAGRGFDPARGDFCAAMNGDGKASSAHFMGAAWIEGDGLYATFDRTVTDVRINWLLYMAP